MSRPILEVKGVSFRYRISRHEYGEPVLKRANLEITRGTIQVLVGSSGAGKSTFLRLLNRLEDPTEGVIRFEGVDLAKCDPLRLRREVALVAQEPYLVDGTVRENLMLPFEDAVGGDGLRKKAETKMETVLHSVGLDGGMLARAARGLSVGEKQRVSLARALMTAPKVMLLDEPTSALDPDNRNLLARTIARINSSDAMTFVVVTHLEDFARALDGRLFRLRDGEIAAL